MHVDAPATGLPLLQVLAVTQHRRIATRYETRAANDQAMLTVAAILLWLETSNGRP